MLLRRLTLYWLPILLWMALIIGLSSQSDLPGRNDPRTGERIPSSYPVAKAWHITEFSVLALLIFRALHSQTGGIGLRPAQAATLSVVACLTFAGLDELRQSFVPKREASVYDVLLDTTAACVAMVALTLWLRASRRVGAT
jgi:VanZ family protein